MVFEKKYDPKKKEPEIRKFWEEEEIYKFDENTDKKIFSIDSPPPTISGKMHIGHAFSFTQEDIIARYMRMNGYEVFCPFGTDDNGLPTEKLVVKEKGISSTDYSREEFIKICQDYLNEIREDFIDDWKKIGMSFNFELYYSTIDDHSRKVSQKSFLDLASKNRVYRKEAPVIWDPVFQTAIAQAELEDVERETHFNDIVFTTEDGDNLTISTTRPELLGACVAVFAHPEDKRYNQLFGKYAHTPIYNAKVPILPDENADPEKGTGIVMCCTFGDQTDIEWYKKHNLGLRVIITEDGRMNEKAGKYQGMTIKEARKQIIEDLKEEGLLIKQTPTTQIVNVGERSGEPVEIINSLQWYVRYLDKKDEFLEDAKRLNWHPPHMRYRLENWINGLNWDWAVARQRHFGVPIPVWYCKNCGEVKFADETQLPVDPLKENPLTACNSCGSNEFSPETDVFDTWFTSGSSPFIARELINNNETKKKLFPMSLRPQAHDIINFWLFYTLAKTKMINGDIPWRDINIYGFVQDPHGNKMSKSKGNVVSPQEKMGEYSGDAVRFAAAGSKLGQDIPFQEKELQAGTRVMNKLYNAHKFASTLLKGFESEDRSFKFSDLKSIDKWIVAKAQETVRKSKEAFKNYDYSKSRHEFENFFMRDVADNYIEIVKNRLWNPEQYGGDNKKAQQTLYYILYTALKGIAPIMPFITEEIYQNFYKEYEGTKSVHLTSYPVYNEEYENADILDKGNNFISIISAVRKYKAANGLSLKSSISKIKISCDKPTEEFISDSLADLKSVTQANSVEFTDEADTETESPSVKIKIEN